MNLDDLKKQWESEQSSKSDDEILRMIAGKSRSVSARARRKALIEAGAFVLLLLVFFTGLDPERNSLWINIFLTLVVLAGIGNNLLLYSKLLVNTKGDSLSQSLQRQIRGQWQQLQLSVLFSVLLFTAVFTFLFYRIDISGPKFWIVLAIFALSVALRSWFEIGRWQQSLRQLISCQLELNAADSERS